MTWFVLLIITPDKLAAVAKAIGRPDLLTDPRFSDPEKLMANRSQRLVLPVRKARPVDDLVERAFCPQHGLDHAVEVNDRHAPVDGLNRAALDGAVEYRLRWSVLRLRQLR
jgi:hypothetical protein